MVEDLFEIRYRMLSDAIAVIDPQFALSDSDVSAIRASDIGAQTCGREIAIAFAKWATHSQTADLDNPFEPWLEIFEHGGYITREHGQSSISMTAMDDLLLASLLAKPNATAGSKSSSSTWSEIP